MRTWVSILRSHIKSCAVLCIFVNPSAGKVESGGIWSLLANQSKRTCELQPQWETLPQKRQRIPLMVISGCYTQICACTHIPWLEIEGERERRREIDGVRGRKQVFEYKPDNCANSLPDALDVTLCSIFMTLNVFLFLHFSDENGRK